MMNSFPKFLRSEPSPRVQDSAFPPFKIEHRYRGVYERAGFEVNLGNSNDNKSIHSKASSRRKPHTRYPSPPKSASNSPLSEVSPNSENKHVYNTSNNSSLSFPKHKDRQQGYISPTGSSKSSTSVTYKQTQPTTYTQDYTGYNQYNQDYSQPGNYTHEDSNASSNSLGQQTPDTFNHPSEYSNYRPQEYLNPYATPTSKTFNNPQEKMPYLEKMPQSAKSNVSFGNVGGRGSVSEARSASHSRNNTMNAIGGYPTSLRAISSSGSNSDALSQEPDHYVQPIIASQQQTNLPPPSEDNFNFSPSTTHHKNFKNLQLDLDSEKIDTISDSEVDNENYAESSRYDSSNDTKNTSIDRLDHEDYQKPYGTQKKRLSDAFDELKRDARAHKEHKTNPTVPELPTVSPSLVASSKFNAPEVPYPVNERLSYSPVNTAAIDPSSQFKTFQQQHNNDKNLNVEYQNFLNGNSATKNARRSQLSMVSSILSKGSMYDDDDEDDEVERELQRQLDTLKMTGSASNMDLAASTSSMDETYSTVPAFTIENVDETDSQKTSQKSVSSAIPTIFTTSPQEDNHVSQQSRSESENTVDFNDMSSTASFDSVKPLVVKNNVNDPEDKKESPVRRTHPKEQAYRGFVSPPALRTVKFDDIVQSKSPNTPVDFGSSPDSLEFPVNETIDLETEMVQPLSPKNHEVEQELKGMNFTIDLALEYPTHNIAETPEAPSHARMDSLDFSPIRPLAPKHQSRTYSPGEGPCRSCHDIISPAGKGSRRSIYSKTGELSGQWHRSCFICNHEDCDIQFSKHVQCYAYNDKPYCHQHYHLLNSTICELCSMGIEGECIENELQQKWHLNCLRCCKCDHTIQDDYFLINNSIFCENDAQDIINGKYDSSGNVIQGGLSTQDRIEKRRTRLLFVD